LYLIKKDYSQRPQRNWTEIAATLKKLQLFLKDNAIGGGLWWHFLDDLQGGVRVGFGAGTT